MTDPTPKTGLHRKLAEVTEAVGRVPKEGWNDHFKYHYVKEEDLVEAVRGELASRHVTLLPSCSEIERAGTITTVKVRFAFVDGETGEMFEADWFGTGDDKSDKGLYKAYTGAVKYFLMKSFLIPTGDDPEGSQGTSKPASDPQMSEASDELRERTTLALNYLANADVEAGGAAIGKIYEHFHSLPTPACQAILLAATAIQETRKTQAARGRAAADPEFTDQPELAAKDG